MKNLFENIGETFSKVTKLRIFRIDFSKKAIVILMTCLILVLACVSIFVVMSENDGTTVVQATSESSTDAGSTVNAIVTSSEAVESELSTNLLFIMTDNDNAKLKIITLLKFDTENNSIEIAFVPSSISVAIEGKNSTLQEFYDTYGHDQLVTAVTEYCGVTIDRYISVSEKNAVEVMNTVGKCDITIDDDAVYTEGDLSYNFFEGTQSLTSELLIKYFFYLSTQKEIGEEKIVEILDIFVKSYLSTTAVESAFEKIVKYVETDISAYDIMQHKHGITRLLLQDDVSVKIY